MKTQFLLFQKIKSSFDESIKAAIESQDDSHPYNKILKLDRLDFDRRISVEKELDKSGEGLCLLDVAWDEGDRILIVPSIFGIKFYDVRSGKVCS